MQSFMIIHLSDEVWKPFLDILLIEVIMRVGEESIRNKFVHGLTPVDFCFAFDIVCSN